MTAKTFLDGAVTVLFRLLQVKFVITTISPMEITALLTAKHSMELMDHAEMESFRQTKSVTRQHSEQESVHTAAVTVSPIWAVAVTMLFREAVVQGTQSVHRLQLLQTAAKLLQEQPKSVMTEPITVHIKLLQVPAMHTVTQTVPEEVRADTAETTRHRLLMKNVMTVQITDCTVQLHRDSHFS